MKFVDNHIEVDPPKRTKKLTGTRFGAVLGMNRWNTPFKVWCEMTKVYEEPFTDSIYTIAGKTIEPKQIEYMKNMYVMDNLRTPSDVFGEDYFNKTHGDFFKSNPIFGGMWDSILVDDNEKPETVLEFKTTKRAEDWKNDVPEYYALQAALYAYLLGTENVIMVCSFLKESDYANPDKFVPSAENTVTVEFQVHERYPDFEGMLADATAFWNEFVLKGISPDYTDADKEIIKELRTNYISDDVDLEALTTEADNLILKISVAKSQLEEQIGADEKRLDALKVAIKEKLVSNLKESDNHAVYGKWCVTRSPGRRKYNEDAMKADGVLDKYSKVGKPIDTLTHKEEK
jgi:predicted phage-related endonuclease